MAQKLSHIKVVIYSFKTYETILSYISTNKSISNDQFKIDSKISQSMIDQSL